MKSKELFTNPPRKYNPRKIIHRYDESFSALLDKVMAEGYGGVVTNVVAKNGFTSNPENIKLFGRMIAELKARELPYWIYDEDGYPSGKADNLVLEGHPELRSRGMFMYKRMTFEDTVARYHLPDEAERIFYAVKYPFGGAAERGKVDMSHPTAVPFTDDYVECQLYDHEVLYVFAIKATHEGTHSMHNANSQRMNINMMDKRAARRFIDVAYEPIAQLAGAYEGAEAVFTDEPSLFSVYNAPASVYNYAMAPWSEDMLEEYEREYGESLLPSLPYIFEGGIEAYPTRVKFHTLVGKLVAGAYSAQLNEWCRAHGTRFSGHYLGEDEPWAHVAYYGDLSSVLRGSGYPGFDILSCYPEIYKYVNDKFPEMIARKMGSGGLMVELCPFDKRAEFDKSPYDNMRCITALCYLHGARVANSYFASYNAQGETERMRAFNEYAGRLSYMLEGLVPESDLYIYYPLENIQARFVPTHSRMATEGERDTQKLSLEGALEALELGGFNPLLADKDDLRAAAESLGEPTICGGRVRTIIFPSVEAISSEAWGAISRLEKMGVKVYFLDTVPTVLADFGRKLESDREAVSIEYVLEELSREGGPLTARANGKVIRGRFRDGDKTLYLLVNTDRAPTAITLDTPHGGELYDLDTGTVTPVAVGESIRLPAMRGVIVVA